MSLLAASTLVLLLAGADIPPATVQAIGAKYPGPVEQAFKAHCADCHGAMPPSLAEPARSTATRKSKRAHRRLNMDDGFPFTSKWEMPRLMTEIREAVADKDMPPKSYLKKKGVSLSEAERQAIVGWATDAEALLKGQTSP
ncbi:MAG: heme-binding domain-containing protein [Gammaproteobacteria bacterium]|nr:heme-binding domain-containing protein [Gammaproteobacteria bacterium]